MSGSKDRTEHDVWIEVGNNLRYILIFAIVVMAILISLGALI